jgi:hypothetical protein
MAHRILTQMPGFSGRGLAWIGETWNNLASARLGSSRACQLACKWESGCGSMAASTKAPMLKGPSRSSCVRVDSSR